MKQVGWKCNKILSVWFCGIVEYIWVEALTDPVFYQRSTLMLSKDLVIAYSHLV